MRPAVVRTVAQDLFAAALIGILLMVPAGTIDWPGAWAFLAEMAVFSIALDLWLRQADPDLFRTRMSARHCALQPRWDRWLLLAYFVLWLGWFAVMGVDVGRHGSAQLAPAVEAAGGLGVAAYYAITLAAFRANTFAAPAVAFQPDRGHRVISTGPYGIVRHPMYAGSVVLFVSAPLLLGSAWGLALAPILIALLGLRCILEERTLAGTLEGYGDYLARVRYRLAPLVW